MTWPHALAAALDPCRILLAQRLAPDPWQRDVLLADDRQMLLNCCRQAGKSTVVAALALHTALFTPESLVLLVSPTLRQSFELFRKVHAAYDALGRPVPSLGEAPSQGRLGLANGSRVLGLPGREATIRGFSGTRLLVLDEAARVPDDLYRSVRPMLAVSQGRLVCLSTPFGQRGFFFEEWHGSGPWRRVRVTHADCPRITADFLAEEERALGRDWIDQEYRCLFTARAGLVYPDFEAALGVEPPPSRGRARAFGGIDWGFRNPFAAVWGVLDGHDVLWLSHERYARHASLHEHLAAIRAAGGGKVDWYADPSGPAEILACRAGGWTVRRGVNDVRLGIAAVTARLRTGRLRVLRSGCPELAAESRLYRYPTAAERASAGENPIDEHNHALGALRYLVASLDHRKLAGLGPPVPPPPTMPAPLSDDHLWTPLS